MNPNNIGGLDVSAYLSWIEIDLAAIRHNYLLLKKHVGPDVDFYPVVKADAYGHGAAQVAKMLQKEGAERLCVARVEEAVELRDSGIDIKLLVFAPHFNSQAIVAARHNLEIVVCDPQHIDAVAHAQKETGKKIAVHIKADIGMGRLGVKPDQVADMVLSCHENGIEVRGIMSHFPCADMPEVLETMAMAEKFKEIRNRVCVIYPDNNIVFHTSNSAAAIRFPTAWFNAVRVGISLYGQFPSVEMDRNLDLRPAMTLKTRIIFLKDVAANTPISYCHTWRAGRPSRLATLALGYADGYPRHASNKTDFLLHGKPAPQVGRVCMDQLLIDVTDIPEAKLGDEVLAFGVDGADILRAEDVAARFDTIGYELTTRIGKRLPRFFLDNGLRVNDTNAVS